MRPIDANYISAREKQVEALDNVERLRNMTQNLPREALQRINPRVKFAVTCADQCDAACADEFNKLLDETMDALKKVPRWEKVAPAK